jgi:hypothetical protein
LSWAGYEKYGWGTCDRSGNGRMRRLGGADNI